MSDLKQPGADSQLPDEPAEDLSGHTKGDPESSKMLGELAQAAAQPTQTPAESTLIAAIPAFQSLTPKDEGTPQPMVPLTSGEANNEQRPYLPLDMDRLKAEITRKKTKVVTPTKATEVPGAQAPTTEVAPLSEATPVIDSLNTRVDSKDEQQLQQLNTWDERLRDQLPLIEQRLRVSLNLPELTLEQLVSRETVGYLDQAFTRDIIVQSPDRKAEPHDPYFVIIERPLAQILVDLKHNQSTDAFATAKELKPSDEKYLRQNVVAAVADELVWSSTGAEVFDGSRGEQPLSPLPTNGYVLGITIRTGKNVTAYESMGHCTVHLVIPANPVPATSEGVAPNGHDAGQAGEHPPSPKEYAQYWHALHEFNGEDHVIFEQMQKWRQVLKEKTQIELAYNDARLLIASSQYPIVTTNHPIELYTIISAPNPTEFFEKTMEYLWSLEALRQQMIDIYEDLMKLGDSDVVQQATTKLFHEYYSRFGRPPYKRTLSLLSLRTLL